MKDVDFCKTYNLSRLQKELFAIFFVFVKGGNELKVVIDLVDTLVNCLKFCHLVTDDNLHTDSQKGKGT